MARRIKPAESDLRLARRARRLAAFHKDYRRFVQDLTVCSESAEDLADSFPGLLFALATGFGTERARGAAFELVEAGAPLRQAADRLGLPWWLRRLPAEAFAEPLGTLPDDAEFSSRIVSYVPRGGMAASRWLAAVLRANRACGSHFAIWTAKSSPLLLPDTCEKALLLLAAWAWHSNQPGTVGNRILRRHWCASMSVRKAREEAVVWQRRIQLATCLGSGLDDTWLSGGRWHGFEFVPLRTVDDFIAESEVMENCLDRFGDEMSTGGSRVFSIRRNGALVADVEIAPDSRDRRMPAIVQLRGPRNRPAAPEVWHAAFSWISRQTLDISQIRAANSSRAAPAAALRDFWRPYLDWLPPEDRRVFEAQFLGNAGATRVRLARTLPPILPRFTFANLHYSRDVDVASPLRRRGQPESID